MTPGRTPVVLDVDTGVDDAIALLLAVRHPALDLRAVTCVEGNAPVDQVLANTLKVLDAAGAPDVPVARGAERPLLGPAGDTRSVHGTDGMADLGLPASPRRPADVHAVELLSGTFVGAPRPVTLVLLAPMTNAAALLRAHPEVAPYIARVVVMGGAGAGGRAGAGGGAGAPAEFNVHHDPQAAAIVLGSGLPVTVYGLDVYHDVTVPDADIRRLAASADPGARLAGRLLLHQAGRFGADRAPLGDAGAVAGVADPDGLTTEGRRGGSVDVAVGVAADRYRRLFLDAVLGAGSGGLTRGSRLRGGRPMPRARRPPG